MRLRRRSARTAGEQGCDEEDRSSFEGELDDTRWVVGEVAVPHPGRSHAEMGDARPGEPLAPVRIRNEVARADAFELISDGDVGDAFDLHGDLAGAQPITSATREVATVLKMISRASVTAKPTTAAWGPPVGATEDWTARVWLRRTATSEARVMGVSSMSERGTTRCSAWQAPASPPQMTVSRPATRPAFPDRSRRQPPLHEYLSVER